MLSKVVTGIAGMVGKDVVEDMVIKTLAFVLDNVTDEETLGKVEELAYKAGDFADKTIPDDKIEKEVAPVIQRLEKGFTEGLTD